MITSMYERTGYKQKRIESVRYINKKKRRKHIVESIEKLSYQMVYFTIDLT